MHSKKFKKIKSWHESGIWTKRMVTDAVIKNWITAAEYEEITGEPFQG